MSDKTSFVFLAEGFEETEAISVYDILKRANIDVELISITSELTVKGAHGLVVQADRLIADVENLLVQAIVLPGGMPGTKNLEDSHILKEIITRHYEADRVVGAICAAPMILGQMGLLNNRKAICYPGFEKYLLGAVLVNNVTSVVDGNIVTSRSLSSAVDFALTLVERLNGKDSRNTIEKAIVY
ncbi:MAG: DJ-1 family glyoxalase III [Bacteroidales bacterium]